jgi:4-nitrophenyl phosphatase
LVDIPGVLAALESRGLAAAFVTNNSTRTAEEIAAKFARLGAKVDPRRIFTSSTVMAAILHEKHPHGGRVFVVGESGLVKPLAERGFLHSHEEPLAVIVGLDREFNYDKLRAAAGLLHLGAEFYATNPDPTLPSPEGMLPGAGSLIAAIETAGGRKALIIGKPDPRIFLTAIAQLGYIPRDCLVVGDRLDTDILGGQAAGCRTALVLTGATSPEMAAGADHPPDFVAENLMELVKSL